MRQATAPRRRGRDPGTVLPLVLAVSVVFAMIVGGIASYVATNLRYSRIVEARADRLAAADGGLRYGVEKLRLFQTLCTTGAGNGGGYTTVFPPEINGATTDVTCRRVGSPISDVQGWGAVVTGEGVPPALPIFLTKGAGGATNNVKTFSGPIYVADPSRIDLGARLEIEDGDLWYSSSNCDVPTPVPEIDTGYLEFEPAFLRGPLCVELAWDEGLFNPPTTPPPPTNTPAPYADVGSCRVFQPGKYTSAPALAAHNYLTAGEYYFEDVDLVIKNQSVVGGYPGGAGDGAKIEMPECEAAQTTDAADPSDNGGRGGAVLFLGGSSRISVDAGGELEIFRRLINETYLSVLALDATGTGYKATTRLSDSWLIETKSGSNNDIAIHGLLWAPYSAISLGNVSNAANGQMLGGVVIALLDTQASNSASAFSIGIESNPVETKLLLVATARKDGMATSIRAVVQFRPAAKELAINSWRVVG